MGSVNEINPKIDLTVRVFDSFFDLDLEVDSNLYDTVNSFFQSVSSNEYAITYTIDISSLRFVYLLRLYLCPTSSFLIVS